MGGLRPGLRWQAGCFPPPEDAATSSGTPAAHRPGTRLPAGPGCAARTPGRGRGDGAPRRPSAREGVGVDTGPRSEAPWTGRVLTGRGDGVGRGEGGPDRPGARSAERARPRGDTAEADPQRGARTRGTRLPRESGVWAAGRASRHPVSDTRSATPPAPARTGRGRAWVARDGRLVPANAASPQPLPPGPPAGHTDPATSLRKRKRDAQREARPGGGRARSRGSPAPRGRPRRPPRRPSLFWEPVWGGGGGCALSRPRAERGARLALRRSATATRCGARGVAADAGPGNPTHR